MTETVDRVAAAMIERWKIGAHPASSPDLPYWQDMARVAIKALRNFDTEDFTLTEAAGIRRLIDDALDPSPLTDRPNPG